MYLPCISLDPGALKYVALASYGPSLTNPNPHPDPNPNLNPNPNPNPNLNPNHLKACFDSRKAECGAAHKELVFIGSRQPPPQAVRSRL